MIVVDASVLAVALVDTGADGRAARARLTAESLAAPDLVDVEVASVWRRQVAAGLLAEQRAAAAIEDLAALPLRRSPHRRLLARIWQLRQAVTAYDAAYVALAEHLGAVLLTADRKLARAPGPTCRFELIG